MTVIQCVPIGISVLAFGFSLYTHFKYDGKIKRQDKLINQFTLKKFEKEAELDKKAIVEVNVVRGDKGKRTLKVYNRGKATAKNVRVTFPGDPNVNIREYLSTVDINPQNSMEIYLTAFIGSPSTLQMEFEWEDGVKFGDCVPEPLAGTLSLHPSTLRVG